MNVTRTLFATMLMLVCGCENRITISDPTPCEPGTTRYVCRYSILYDDPKGNGGECYFPPLDVCAPENDASLYEQGVAAHNLGVEAYGDVPWGPGLVERLLDCQLPDMAPPPAGVPCSDVPH
jgi:hypothetical protein